MPNPHGRHLPLSLPRRFICDLVHFAKKVPSVPVERRMDLAAVVASRQESRPRPSWVSIFTKAYGIVAAERAELRRAYLSFPAAHFYEHPINIASIAVERQINDEHAVLFAPIRNPEQESLVDLDAEMRRLKEQPVETIASFRRALNLSRVPRPLRRLIWSVALNAWGRKRAHYMGTFGVSVYSGLGAASLHPLSPLTTTLNYGTIDATGGVDVRLIYDHRVLDGASVARALQRLEDVLNTAILAEMHGLRYTLVRSA